MPKSLSLGNGNILILLDQKAQVRDFYFPFVGLENHTGVGYIHKIGVWVDDKFSWFDEGWQFNIDYQDETLASKISAVNQSLQLELDFTDVVYNEKNIFIRKVSVKNTAGRERKVKVYFNQQLAISESRRGITAYYEPINEVIIHYKGRRVFLVGGRSGKVGFDDFSIGLLGIEGKEGTYKDAEDGELSKNSVEYGNVDSVISFTLNVPSGESKEFYYWVTVAEELTEAINLHNYILGKLPDHLIESTQSYWKAWVNKYDFDFYGLDSRVVEVFKKSLLIMRTHVDNNGGILASGDSGFLQYGRDNYSYVWPRDASMTALALDKAGNFEVTRKYFEFCNQVVSEEGYLHHKYRPDKALGSTWHPWFRGGKRELAIQEDESALTLFALWKHYKLTRDLEFVEQVYNSFIKKLADFMVLYRDSKLKLPQSSYDLWEEKFGTSTYTSSTVYGALIAASNFANLLMKREDETNYLMAAREIKTGIMKHLYNPSEKYFYRTIKIKDGVVTEKDQTVDASSFYGIFYFKVLDIDDPRLKDAEKVVREKLGCQTQIGGIARYTEDQYFRTNPSGPGNPWFITTLWLTKYKIACANNESDLKRVREDLEWVASRANSAGVLSEQLDSYTGEQLSAIPLTMSHAEFVSTVISYLNKLEELGVREVCNPVK